MPLSLEIVTPEERVVTLTCDEVRLTSVEGQFGIRPGHTPLVAALAAGELLYVAGGTTHRYAAG
ncbi:MAG: F0F1 ATP synthase subunit epsilon, partial [Myxococcales bacterium]